MDEALKDYATGAMTLGETKTDGSMDYVAISSGLQEELKQWIKGLKDQSASAWLFPSESATPFRPPNYLSRKLKPFAKSLGISSLTFRLLRSTCATYFRQDLKSAQAQLRHASPMMTAKHYMKTIPAEQIAAVEAMDREFAPRKTARKAGKSEPQVSPLKARRASANA